MPTNPHQSIKSFILLSATLQTHDVVSTLKRRRVSTGNNNVISIIVFQPNCIVLFISGYSFTSSETFPSNTSLPPPTTNVLHNTTISTFIPSTITTHQSSISPDLTNISTTSYSNLTLPFTFPSSHSETSRSTRQSTATSPRVSSFEKTTSKRSTSSKQPSTKMTVESISTTTYRVTGATMEKTNSTIAQLTTNKGYFVFESCTR